MRAIEVQIDEAGNIRPLDAALKLPPGRAVLSWPEDGIADSALGWTKAFDDWLRPEEDEAWAYLQPPTSDP